MPEKRNMHAVGTGAQAEVTGADKAEGQHLQAAAGGTAGVRTCHTHSVFSIRTQLGDCNIEVVVRTEALKEAYVALVAHAGLLLCCKTGMTAAAVMLCVLCWQYPVSGAVVKRCLLTPRDSCHTATKEGTHLAEVLLPCATAAAAAAAADVRSECDVSATKAVMCIVSILHGDTCAENKYKRLVTSCHLLLTGVLVGLFRATSKAQYILYVNVRAHIKRLSSTPLSSHGEWFVGRAGWHTITERRRLRHVFK
jgi:hypothetical protein